MGSYKEDFSILEGYKIVEEVLHKTLRCRSRKAALGNAQRGPRLKNGIVLQAVFILTLFESYEALHAFV